MKEDFFELRYDENSNTNQLEVYFCDVGFTPLYKSELNKNEFYLFGCDFSIGDISNVDIDINIDSSKNIRIWTSRSNVEEYLNFIYICYKCKCNDISVVFVDDYSEFLYSLGATNYSEIVELLKYERHLTRKDIENYGNEWLELVRINSELRIFSHKKIISVNYDYLDEYILKCYNEEEDINKVIAKLMGYDEENNLSDKVYRFLIDRLIVK